MADDNKIGGKNVEMIALVNKYADILIGQFGRNLDEFIAGAASGEDRSARLQAAVHSMACVAQKMEFSAMSANLPVPAVTKLRCGGIKRAADMLQSELLQRQIMNAGKLQ